MIQEINNMAKDKKRDLPYMPFYVGDWLKCPEVRALPPDYRGLWFDLLCYMWESSERGVMINPNGRPYTDDEIIRMVGLDNQNTNIWLTRLLTDGVCYRRDDGAIFSKRMVRDEKTRQIRRETGAKGGNPTLLVKDIDNSDVNQNPDNDIDNDIDIVSEIKRKRTPFKKPTIQEVRNYFDENGYNPDFGETRWHYYNDANWFDSHGSPVLNWKQKMRSVWFKPENKKQSERIMP
ncbi:MAG TPA: hypothetical protein DDW27_08455 [Bacteroidales bacterium]|nr:hypothetical protein [Bacteroidales bacterium]